MSFKFFVISGVLLSMVVAYWAAHKLFDFKFLQSKLSSVCIFLNMSIINELYYEFEHEKIISISFVAFLAFLLFLVIYIFLNLKSI